MNTTEQPIIKVENDYDNTFLRRVNQAIALNKQNNIKMVDVIHIDSGPYRSHCLEYRKKEDNGVNVCYLDFYSANRVFGFQHTIEDIATSIAL